jgi:hypothetical protein
LQKQKMWNMVGVWWRRGKLTYNGIRICAAFFKTKAKVETALQKSGDIFGVRWRSKQFLRVKSMNIKGIQRLSSDGEKATTDWLRERYSRQDANRAEFAVRCWVKGSTPTRQSTPQPSDYTVFCSLLLKIAHNGWGFMSVFAYAGTFILAPNLKGKNCIKPLL